MIIALEQWKAASLHVNPEAWVPLDMGTPLSRDTVLRRSISPRLKTVGLAWVNFQVLRRTPSTLMNRIEGSLLQTNLGHFLDVNQNVDTGRAEEGSCRPVGTLSGDVNGIQRNTDWKWWRKLLDFYGAGDGVRTRDVQLGKTTVNWKQRTLRFPAPLSGD